jgi:hypothetical protein
MSQFEFLMTFASVVLAIAMTELLAGWGRLARSGVAIRWSPIWVGWSVVLVLLITMYWSGIWPYRDQSFGEGYKILWLVLPTFLLVVLSFLLSPEPDREASEVDLEALYARIAPRMFPILAVFIVATQTADLVIEVRVPERMGPPPAVRALLPTVFALVVACCFSRARWLHWLALAGFGFGGAYFLFAKTGLFE